VIASPWSRGGYVNSQVFDHTSSLQFLEKFILHKTGKKIEEANISAWRRAICGDLSSIFRPYKGEKISFPATLNKDLFIESIHKAKFKNPPADYKKLSIAEIETINTKVQDSPNIPVQEKGIRPANVLPYQMYTVEKLNVEENTFEIYFGSAKSIFKDNTVGVPFMAYAMYKDDMKVRSYAVAAGDIIKDSWQLSDFENNNYQLEVHGPNGFFRSFRGNKNDAGLRIDFSCPPTFEVRNITENIRIVFENRDTVEYSLEITDHYTGTVQTKKVRARGFNEINFDLSKTFSWYDVSVRVKGNNIFERRYAGKVETGKESFTDPMMGRVV
jgi:phospholipase C